MGEGSVAEGGISESKSVKFLRRKLPDSKVHSLLTDAYHYCDY